MFANLFAAVVFLGLLFAMSLLSWGRWLRAAADRRELARRIGGRPDPRRVFQGRRLGVLERVVPAVGIPLRQRILRAGVEFDVDVLAFLTFGSAAVGAYAASVTLPSGFWFTGIVAGFLPLAILDQRALARGNAAAAQLPEAMDLIASGLRNGSALPQALAQAAAELPMPLGDVLRPVAEEQRLGLGLRESLMRVFEVVPESFELRLFVSAVLLQQDTGGNLVEVLERISETVRERIVFEEKVRTMTAEARASGTILAGLPILAAIGLAVFVPTYLQALLEPGPGRVMLASSVMWMIFGYVVMRRIANPEPR